MRLFNFVAWTGIAILVAVVARPAYAEAVMQKVCHEDAKTKREICKTIKTHKKVEGTPVPEKAPAKSKLAKK
jgi:uncharacterized protein YcfJ